LAEVNGLSLQRPARIVGPGRDAPVGIVAHVPRETDSRYDGEKAIGLSGDRPSNSTMVRGVRGTMDGSAVFSDCEQYRYVLRRTWNATHKSVLFIGLNPSTADAKLNDPTIRRCIGFARDWGYGSMLMANLFAYRATEPCVLPDVDDPIGPRNNWWLSVLQRQVDLVVAAWGIHGTLLSRDVYVLSRLSEVHCLGLTKAGHPKHPLYLPATVTPARFFA
jgi:hypothetical protein